MQFLKAPLLVVLLLLPFFSISQISGSVFRDYNGNGTQGTVAPNIEPGVIGVTVNAYNSDNLLFATQETSVTGSYAFPAIGMDSIANGANVRLEFILSLSATCSDSGVDYPSFCVTNDNTSVQFITGGAAAVNVNFAINDPADFVDDTNPTTFVPCYVAGDPLANGSSASAEWFVGFPYNNTGLTAPSQKLNGDTIGTVWGVAYSKQAKKVFTSAFLKRHTGFGILGSGGIYILTPTAASFTASSFYDMDDVAHSGAYRTRADAATAPSYGIGTSFNLVDDTLATYLGAVDVVSGLPIGFGVVGENGSDRGLPASKTARSNDPAAFDQIGKVGLGGLDISEDGKFLFVTNLYDKKIYRLELDDAHNPTGVVSVTSYALPAVSVNNGVLRPFATKYHRGKLYVGAVTTGENGGGNIVNGATDLYAYVFELDDPTGTPTFNATPTITYALNYQKGFSFSNVAKQWYPWTNSSNGAINPVGTAITYPSPMLTGIEFSDDNALVMSFTDRGGHQWGWSNYRHLSGSGLETYRQAGDMLIAGTDCSTNTYTLESNGSYTNNGVSHTGAAANNQGPGGGEFFYREIYLATHQETSFGATSVLRGDDKINFTIMDPIAINEGGIVKFSTDNAAKTGGYRLYKSSTTSSSGSFGKANGLGDVELSRSIPGLEIGNRIWEDSNGDGIQDAGESGFVGVNVELFSSAGVLLASTVSDANGLYYFSHSDETSQTWVAPMDSVEENTAYYIVFGNSQFANDELTIGGENYYITVDSTNSGANRYAIDSNGETIASSPASAFDNMPVIHLTTGNYGEVNHTYGQGFVSTNLILPIDDDENTLVNMEVDGNILTNDFDPESDNMTLVGIEDPMNLGTYINTDTIKVIPGTNESGTPVADAGDIIIGTNGVYTFIPANNFTGIVKLSYKIIDDNSTPVSDKAILTITVTGTPDVTSTTENITIANDDENVTYKNIAVSGNVMANDADPTFDKQTFSGFDDGGGPTIYINSGALNDVGGKDMYGNAVTNAGDFIISTNGDYTFTPETGFTGTVELDYKNCDDGTPQSCTIAKLVITVLPDAVTNDNDKPFASDDFTSTVLNTPSKGNYTDNDQDPNTNSMSFMGTTIDPAVGTPTTVGIYPTQKGGTVEMFDDGTYTYTPLAGYSGPDNYKYQICDVTATNPQPLCDSVTLNMIVFPLYRDFSDLDSTIYAPAYNWGAVDANSDNIPDSSNAFWLGEKVDYEVADLTSAMADGDDNDGINDDDGLVTPATLSAGGTETFTTKVNANSATTVHFGIWIDWDANGTFEDFYTNSGNVDGMSSLSVSTTINVPAPYAGGDVHIRQRAFNSVPMSADFSGNRQNGEVEDFVIAFAVLPVELISFQGSVVDCFAKLTWETASEENFSHYEIERSDDGSRFDLVQKITAQGGTSLTSYESLDESKLNKRTIYYRLKMVDLDNSFEYSSIISLQSNCVEENGIQIYPNPLLQYNKQFTLIFSASNNEEVFIIYDAKGGVVKSISRQTEVGENTVTVDVPNLPKGFYSLQQVGTKKSKVFIIQ